MNYQRSNTSEHIQTLMQPFNFQRSTLALLQVLSYSLILLLTSCSSSSESQQSIPADDNVLTKSLEQSLTMSLGDKPGGLSVLLRSNGESKHAMAGIADDQGNALTQQSVFRVGSVSKIFVATIMMQLVEEGQVKLDNPLSDYLPDSTVGSAASVKALLSHRAGVANYTAVPGFFETVFADRSREFEPTDMLDFVNGAPQDSSGNFAYSNTHYILLGQLIEKLDGGSLQSSLERRITKPLKLESTRFVIRDEQQPGSMVPGWAGELSAGNFDTPYTSISSSAWAAGALVSNVPDLEVFMDALLSGTLVQPATLELMSQFGDDGYGLGISQFMLDSQITGVGHNGSIPGYISLMAMTADRNTAVIVLTNNESVDINAVAVKLLEVNATESSE